MNSITIKNCCPDCTAIHENGAVKIHYRMADGGYIVLSACSRHIEYVLEAVREKEQKCV